MSRDITLAEPAGFQLLLSPDNHAMSAQVPGVLAGVGHSSDLLGIARSRTVLGFGGGLARRYVSTGRA